MECDCTEATSCEGIPHPPIRKERAKGLSKVCDAADMKIKPLFSLPPELMDCHRCKRKCEERKQRKLEDTYTGKRMRTEHFRRFMVGLIVRPELTGVDIDLDDDQEVNRYYNYVCSGVDAVHTVQIHDDVLEKILNLVPYCLRDRFNYYTEDLLIEIKDTFTQNIKKAILEFALQDPLEEYLFEKSESKEIYKIRYALPSLVAQVREYRETLRNNLFLINPCMRMTLDQWIRNFRDFRLIDSRQIVEHTESWDLTEFESTIFRQIENGRKTLKNSWYSGIQDIFLVVKLSMNIT